MWKFCVRVKPETNPPAWRGWSETAKPMEASSNKTAIPKPGSIHPSDFHALPNSTSRIQSWLPLLLILRMTWQVGIILLYGILSPNLGFRAIYAIGVAGILASNLILTARLEHPGWPRVQQWAILVESAFAAILAGVMMSFAMDGPAPLLILPSTVTYAIRFQRNRHQLFLISLTVFVYAGFVAANLLFPESAALWTNAWKRWTLIGAYGAIVIFGLTLADLVQRQRQERLFFESAREQMQSQTWQLERSNQQLNEYANQVYSLAAVEERNRIAGEIHDTVAHRLTALLVQLQAARRILGQGDLATVEGNLLVCEELARESLEEVRTSVRAIRRTTADEGVQSLKRLALQYASLTGMDVQFQAHKGAAFVPIPMMAVLYRAIQEGLTNAQRHGRATAVEVSLVRKGLYLQLEISDNGRGQPAPSLGFGLTSMRDRLQQFGGELLVESQPGQGFLLRVRLPLWEENGI